MKIKAKNIKKIYLEKFQEKNLEELKKEISINFANNNNGTIYFRPSYEDIERKPRRKNKSSNLMKSIDKLPLKDYLKDLLFYIFDVKRKRIKSIYLDCCYYNHENEKCSNWYNLNKTCYYKNKENMNAIKNLLKIKRTSIKIKKDCLKLENIDVKDLEALLEKAYCNLWKLEYQV